MDSGFNLCVGGRSSRKWAYRFTSPDTHKATEMGRGSAFAVTLKEARDKAHDARRLVARGINPIAERRAAKKHEATPTFGACATSLIAAKRSDWRSKVHAQQWCDTIDDYCKPILGAPVDVIDTKAVLEILTPLWGRIPETASRLRGRIEAVLDYARAHGFIDADRANPARWKGHLDKLLPKRPPLSRGHHSAVPYANVLGFLAGLRERETIPAMALEFAILTAGRAGEVLGSKWSEFDMAAKVWTIPAARMKAGREHRVPLSGRTVDIIEKLAAIRCSDFVFAGQSRGRPLSRSTLAALLSPSVTVHGFRSSFRDWVSEETSFPREIAEGALAHATGTAVEQAYRRGDALEKRRLLMQSWADYCGLRAAGNVVQLRA